MTRWLSDPLIWSAGLALLMLAAWLTGSGIVADAMPLVALVAWGFVLWRLAAVIGERRRLRMAPPAAPSTERVNWEPPPIVGEVTAAPSRPQLDPADLQRHLSARVIGQDTVADQIARGIYRRLAQTRRGKPVFTALLSGPTGTGKTEFAKALAEYLFGSADAMFRVDCANVLGEAGLQTLIGSPKGFAGSQSWGALTSHLRASPRTVLLFDELEKAVTSPTAPLAKLLLSILDEGVCTEQSDGTKVLATGAVILMTSNAAQAQLAEVHARHHGDPEELLRATKDVLRDHFAPEFLARLDLVTTLAPLDQAARERIIAYHTGRIGQAYGVEVAEIDASFASKALRRWAKIEGYGTREIIRWIENKLADSLIAAKSAGQHRVRIAWVDERAVVDPMP